MSHDDPSESSNARPSARDSSGIDRRFDQGYSDEGNPSESGVLSEPGIVEEEPSFQQLASFSYRYQGPLPDPITLRGYDDIYPGFAKALMDQHLNAGRVSTDGIKKLSSAESFGVRWGVIAAMIIPLSALFLSGALIVLGYKAGAIATIIPAILGALAPIVNALKNKGNSL